MGSSIWPGPECLKTRALQPGDRVVLLAFALLASPEWAALSREWSEVPHG
jgi:hypothetical protein